MKMVVRHFMFLRFFGDKLRSKFAIFWGGGGNAYFCRKEAKVAQRST